MQADIGFDFVYLRNKSVDNEQTFSTNNYNSYRHYLSCIIIMFDGSP